MEVFGPESGGKPDSRREAYYLFFLFPHRAYHFPTTTLVSAPGRRQSTASRSSDLVLQAPLLGIWPFLNRTGLVPPVTIGKGDRSRACDRSGARGGLLWEGEGRCDRRQVPIVKGAKINAFPHRAYHFPTTTPPFFSRSLHCLVFYLKRQEQKILQDKTSHHPSQMFDPTKTTFPRGNQAKTR